MEAETEKLENVIEKHDQAKTKGKSENGKVNNTDEDKAAEDITSAETQLERIPYPKSVFFIISNEFCERFSYYGMRTILSLYLRDILLYTESDSKVIYHTFTMLAYFFPLFGAIMSDSWLGKYKTILYVSIIYALGNVLLALSSATPLHIPQAPFSLVALLLIAIGTGGIKPCVSAFGGDQFVIPQQEKQLIAFFSVFYFSINAGSLISTFLTPVLREKVHCFDADTCYPLAFAVPGALMIVSVLIFFLGTPLYQTKKPEGNIVVKVVKCVSYGAKKNFKSKEKLDHWLDHAETKYDRSLIEDIKITLKVIVIMTPLPIFWALYDQQGSAWTFQATRMDGRLGSWTILPDQMQVINPFLILLFIPLFTYGVYPLMDKLHIPTKALHRMVYGGFLAAVAFVVSAGIYIVVEATYPVLPTSGSCQLRIYNPQDVNVRLNVPDLNIDLTLEPMGYEYINPQVANEKNVTYTLTANELGINTDGLFTVDQAKGFFIYATTSNLTYGVDDISKPENGLPNIRTLVGNAMNGINVTYKDGNDTALNILSSDSSLHSISPGTYKLGDFPVEFLLGGVYTVLVTLNNKSGDVEHVKKYQVTEPNTAHMLLQVPQYVIITAAEIMFSITGLEFSYSQAPTSMKSVVTSVFLLTSAVGNLIIVIIESSKIFDKESYNFLLYTGLMLLDMFLFTWMAIRYKYVKTANTDENANKIAEAESSQANRST